MFEWFPIVQMGSTILQSPDPFQVLAEYDTAMIPPD
ncbi:hypothetical protein RKD29_001511 [Streptomyces tendae]